MPDPSPLIRREVIRFLCERSALPHALSAMNAGLRRAGTDSTEDLIIEALSYLEDRGFVIRNAPALGGGYKASTWRATAAGKDFNDNEP